MKSHCKCETRWVLVGRIQVMLLMRLIGFSTLLWMGLDQRIWHNVPLIIGIYQLRTAANNCSYPIQKSVLMDFVPKVTCLFAYQLISTSSHVLVPPCFRRLMIMLFTPCRCSQPVISCHIGSPAGFCAQKHRGKWNSVESIMIFGWSGSALVGGWLVDEFGFDVTFIITGVLQAVGWVVSHSLAS